MSQVEVRSRQFDALARMLGVAMLMLMGKWIGNNGIAYFAAAVEIFSLLYLLLARSVPDVLGKLLRSRRAKEQYRNADRMRNSVLAVQLALGLVGSAAVLLCADVLADVCFQMPYSAFPMRLLMPVLLLRVIGNILEADFQGNGSQMPTVASGFLRQILIIFFGCFLVPLFQGYGEKVENLLLNDNMPAMYGAAGLAAAMAVSELLVIAFLTAMYFGNRRSGQKQNKEGLKRTEGFAGSVRIFYVSAILTVLVSVLTRLPGLLGLVFYQRKAEDAASVWDYGVFYGGYLALCAFPVLLCGVVLLPVAARAISGIRKGEPRFSRDMCGIGIHIGLVCTLFPAVYYAVMAEHLAKVFGAEQGETLARLLRTGSFLILEAGLTAFFIRILMNTGKELWALGASACFAAVFFLGLVIFVNGWNLGVLGISLAGLTAGAVLCVLTGILFHFRVKAKFRPLNCLILPAASALLAGLACFLLSALLGETLGNIGVLVLTLVVGTAVYLAPQILFHTFREPELKFLPGGALLGRLSSLSPIRRK